MLMGGIGNMCPRSSRTRGLERLCYGRMDGRVLFDESGGDGKTGVWGGASLSCLPEDTGLGRQQQ